MELYDILLVDELGNAEDGSQEDCSTPEPKSLAPPETLALAQRDPSKRDQPYICLLCGDGYHQKYALLQHMRSEHDLFETTQSSSDYELISNLASEAESLEPPEKGDPLELQLHPVSSSAAPVSKRGPLHGCFVCDDPFHQKPALLQHLRTQHQFLADPTISCAEPINLPPAAQPVHLASGKFECRLCDKQFCRKVNAVQHLLTHLAQKGLECDRCSFRCYTKSQLEVHKVKHKKRYSCDLCPKKFSYPFQLETHVQGVHYNIRPFSCSICNKTFKTRYNYGSHLARHKDIRNFQCPYCPHKARKSYDLRIHIRTHTGEKPYLCSHCNRSFSQKGDRMKHERSMHSKSRAKQEDGSPKKTEVGKVHRVFG